MAELLADILIPALFARMIATSLIVVLVAITVGRLGPVVGGLVAGLPIGLGPGFYFLLGNSSTDFLIQTATFSLLALCATQIFLTVYIATAKYGFPKTSLLTGILIWGAVLAGLNQIPVTLPSTTLLFGVATIATYLLGRRFQMARTETQRKEGLRMLLLRAFVAGFLVALVTTLAPKLGGALSGILLAFPVGYALISVTIHEQYGAASVIGVLHSALLGTIGLAVFCVAFALALQIVSERTAFAMGLGASLAITACMMLGAIGKRQ